MHWGSQLSFCPCFSASYMLDVPTAIGKIHRFNNYDTLHLSHHPPVDRGKPPPTGGYGIKKNGLVQEAFLVKMHKRKKGWHSIEEWNICNQKRQGNLALLFN